MRTPLYLLMDKVIFNGDDFGYTKANTYGIIEAFQKGVLRSTTALMNSKYIDLAKMVADENPQLGVGVHLTLTLGKPLTQNKTLHDENGNFYSGRTTIWTHDIDYNEVYQELKAQIERYYTIFQRKPTHLDSHHSIHDYNETMLKITKDLSQEYNLPLRRYNQFVFVSGFYGPRATLETMEEIFRSHKGEDIEIMCHPGYCDLELYRESSYALDRVKELDVLCDERLKQCMARYARKEWNYGNYISIY